MSWPSSNFHHDSFEYILPQRPEYKPSRTFINHNTYINFNGPSSSSIRTAGWLNFAGRVFQGLTNLGSAWMLSKGNQTGAQAFQMGGSTIGNLLGGGTYGMYNSGWGTGGGYLIDQTYYNPVPLIPSSAVSGTSTDKPEATDPGKKPKPTDPGKKPDGADPGKKPDGADPGKKPEGADPGKKPEGADPGKKPDGADPDKKPDAATGNGKITAQDFNNAIDDTLDTNGDGKVDDKDKIFSADIYNSKYQLGHTTSKANDKNGIRHGVAASKKKEGTDGLTENGFYQYITVTDEKSNNQWTYEYVKIDEQGNPVYKFSPTYSDLSKDNNGNDKGWETTGQSPQVTITVDKQTGKISMVSNGNIFSATQKGHLGKI